MFKQNSDSAAAAPAEPADAVQQARTRARHRLIGAVVLLAIGVIGFPLVFETQPRPVPIDIPIEIPRRDAMPPLAMPSAPAAASSARVVVAEASPPVSATPAAPQPARTGDAVITESARDAGRDVTPPARPAAASAAATRPAASTPARAAAPTPPARTASATGSDGERARALLEGRGDASPATASATAAADGTRFVVQVGAFADAQAAREVRKQVDRIGLKTYTQVAQTASGSRIRVRAGPFTSRAEADAALAKAKAAGLNAVVLTL